MRKIRLSVVTPAHWKTEPGGAEYQIEYILSALSPSDKYEITYVARHAEVRFQTSSYRLMPVGRYDKHPRWGYLEDAVELYQALRSIRPDVIYQRVGCAYTGVAAWYARQHRASLIWHVAHDSDVMRDSSFYGRNPVRRLLEKRSLEYGLRNATKIVAQTDFQAELLHNNYARRADAVIPNFHPVPTEKIDKSGPLQVLWIANLKPWKQPEAFVRLAAALRDLVKVRFVMIGAAASGPGNREWNEKLMDAIQRAGNIDYLGAQSQAAVNELLARSHLFVNTSLHEGFPNTFIQAWLREVPVLSLHVNPDNLLDSKKIGIHTGSEQRLAAQTRELITEEPLRSAYAARARAHALQNHSIENVGRIEQLIELCGRAGD